MSDAVLVINLSKRLIHCTLFPQPDSGLVKNETVSLECIDDYLYDYVTIEFSPNFESKEMLSYF